MTIKTKAHFFLVIASVFVITACGEKPQTVTAKPGQSAAKPDDKPYGSGTQFADRAAWERSLRARADNQNEYKRVN
jgi:predicted small lipoprotein YifL